MIQRNTSADSSYHKSISFPRKDWEYMKNRSLNFDLLRTKIFNDREKSQFMKFMVWSAYALIGLLVGLTAACMTNIEHHLLQVRRNVADELIGGEDG